MSTGEVVSLRTTQDIVLMRQRVRERAIAAGFSLVEQTKLVTAASELGRNTVIHGGGGEVSIQAVEEGARVGLQLVFSDRGPGIADIALALQDGYSSGHGLGMGLGGAKRLSNEFRIESSVGEGTRITIGRWK